MSNESFQLRMKNLEKAFKLKKLLQKQGIKISVDETLQKIHQQQAKQANLQAIE